MKQLKARFGIFDAVQKAYAFAGAEWRYLLKIGTLPLLLNVGTGVFVQMTRPDAATLEIFLWNFPANAFFAWYAFALVRLLLLGERIDRLPPNPEFLFERRRLMTASVLILLLFNMAVVAAGAFFEWVTKSHLLDTSMAAMTGCAFVIGALFWGLRFGTLHVLAAVGYPLRPFLARVQGLFFSLQLLGLGLACLFPIYIVFEMIVRVLVTDLSSNMTDVQALTVLVLTAPLGLIMPTLLNAAITFALKDVLGK